jgi:hypothetical protein
MKVSGWLEDHGLVSSRIQTLTAAIADRCSTSSQSMYGLCSCVQHTTCYSVHHKATSWLQSTTSKLKPQARTASSIFAGLRKMASSGRMQPPNQRAASGWHAAESMLHASKHPKHSTCCAESAAACHNSRATREQRVNPRASQPAAQPACSHWQCCCRHAAAQCMGHAGVHQPMASSGCCAEHGLLQVGGARGCPTGSTGHNRQTLPACSWHHLQPSHNLVAYPTTGQAGMQPSNQMAQSSANDGASVVLASDVAAAGAAHVH